MRRNNISFFLAIADYLCLLRPTEPILRVVRNITPPLFGVDISPIVVYAVLSFIREIFLGQQGVFTMIAMKDL